MRRGWPVGAGLALLLPLMACAPPGATPGPTPGPTPCPAPLRPAQRIEMFFGLTWPGGSVSAADWNAYAASDLTPRFPDGMTVLEATGQWRPDTGSIMQEPSRLAVLIVPPGIDAVALARAAAEAYRRRFQQHSVGIAASSACVAF